MKKLENFTNSLSILAEADFKLAEENDIYRTGIIGQFNLTFELAWKALQEIMRLHSVEGAATGSPREILQLGYKIGFINDSEVWLLMLKKRNTSVQIQDIDIKMIKSALYFHFLSIFLFSIFKCLSLLPERISTHTGNHAIPRKV